MIRLIASDRAAVAMALLMSIAMCGCGRSAAPARQVIGVSMAHFDDNFLTILRTAMVEHAAGFPEIDLRFADAQGDVGRQLSQIQNFAAQDAAAIIVNAADTSATPGMTKIAREAGVPLVYVNRRPAEETLPAGVVFVGLRRSSGWHAADGRARAADEPPRKCRDHGRRARVERRAASHESRRERRREIPRHEDRSKSRSAIFSASGASI